MYPDKTEALRQVRPTDDASPEPRRREHRVEMTFAEEAAPALRASTSPAPTHKPRNRGLFIWSVALFALAGLCVLGTLTFYQTAPRSVSVIAESARAVMPLAVSPEARSNDGSNAIEFSRPSTDVPASIQLFLPATKDIESRTGLLEQVRTVKFATVDIEAARAALSRLVEGGNAWAAVDLGSTYDPNL